MSLTIDQQIDWVQRKLKSMRKGFPQAVAEGKFSQEHAAYKIACAEAVLCTLTQLRGIVRSGGAV